MTGFRQAAPDPDKASRDGVANYIPSRSQVNTSHTCGDCARTAKWDLLVEGRQTYACDEHRTEYAISAWPYEEKRLR